MSVQAHDHEGIIRNQEFRMFPSCSRTRTDRARPASTRRCLKINYSYFINYLFFTINQMKVNLPKWYRISQIKRLFFERAIKHSPHRDIVRSSRRILRDSASSSVDGRCAGLISPWACLKKIFLLLKLATKSFFLFKICMIWKAWSISQHCLVFSGNKYFSFKENK